jgi:hypothetical protein
MNVTLSLAKGGQAAIIANDGDHVVVLSSIPSPPGSTLEARHEELGVLVKVRGCKRDPDAPPPLSFRIEGRLVSLTRVARERLFGGPPSPVV